MPIELNIPLYAILSVFSDVALAIRKQINGPIDKDKLSTSIDKPLNAKGVISATKDVVTVAIIPRGNSFNNFHAKKESYVSCNMFKSDKCHYKSDGSNECYLSLTYIG